MSFPYSKIIFILRLVSLNWLISFAINQDYSDTKQIEVYQSKYLYNIIKQDHRFIKKRSKLTLGFKSFHGGGQTIKGIKILHMIKKGQLKNDNQKNKTTFEQFTSLVA